MDALLAAGETRIDGFILPGHVSAVIGVRAWRFISERYGRPCVVAGFDAPDLIMGMLSLVDLVVKGKSETINQYTRVVREDGNQTALEIMDRVFAPADTRWRGIGVIPASGLAIGTSTPISTRAEIPGYAAGAPGAEGLPVRRAAARPDRPARLRPVRKGLHAGGADRSLHGIHGGALRGILQVLEQVMGKRYCRDTAAAASS